MRSDGRDGAPLGSERERPIRTRRSGHRSAAGASEPLRFFPPLRLWEQRPREPRDTTLIAVIIKNNNNNKNPLLPGLNDPLHTFPSRSLPRPPSEGHWLFALLCLPRAQPDERTLSSSDSIACSSSSPQPRFPLSPNWALANMIKAQLNVSW